jgi:hypothetical protein
MTYKSKILHSLDARKASQDRGGEDANMLADLMASPEYLRHSSAVINDALKDGFDVLQLPNGDIVTTGTKTIVNTYVWDAKAARLDKTRTPSVSKTRAHSAKADANE